VRGYDSLTFESGAGGEARHEVAGADRVGGGHAAGLHGGRLRPDGHGTAPVVVADRNLAPDGQPRLLAIDVRHHEGYDRVDFRFSRRAPGYSIRHVDQVTDCTLSFDPVSGGTLPRWAWDFRLRGLAGPLTPLAGIGRSQRRPACSCAMAASSSVDRSAVGSSAAASIAAKATPITAPARARTASSSGRRPLVMGATYDEANNDYTIGLSLLFVTAVVAFLFVLLRLKREHPAASA